MLGKPRYTADVDAMFLLYNADLPQFLEHARMEHIIPRVENVEDFARKNRVLLMRYTPTQTNIDISMGASPFEEEMTERSVFKSFAKLTIRLPSVEDLIIMKAIAHRPKDIEDIRTIVDNNPNLDIPRIERWVKDYAELLYAPDLWDEIRKILEREE